MKASVQYVGPSTPPSHPWWRILSWQIFEAGDSSWSLIVLSTYFSAFVTSVLLHSATEFGGAVTAAALLVAVLSPILGAMADESGQRQPYLRFCVLGTVVCTAAIGYTRNFPLAVALFALAYILVNSGFNFFMSMVPAVSNERNVARVIAGAVSISYALDVLILLVLAPVVPSDALSYRVFLPIAIIYLGLAMPCMFIAPDFVQRSPNRLDVAAAYRHIATTFKEARKHATLFRFLVADFLYENAVASVITLMGLYSREVMGFTAGELATLFVPAIIVAAIAASAFGWLVERFGPKRMIVLDLCVWFSLFCAALLITEKTTFKLVVAPLAGIGLGGVWSASRVMLTALTPVHKSGEFWGLYNLSGRTASVVGDATWTSVLTVLGENLFGYKAAVASLAVYILLGGLITLTLPDVRPTSENVLGPTGAGECLA